MQRLWDGKEPDEVEELGTRAAAGRLECRDEEGGARRALREVLGLDPKSIGQPPCFK